jgi:hypothetical protein
MKKSIGILFVAAIWLTNSHAQPKLAIENMEINMGVLFSGSTTTGKIPIKNIGNQPLKIIRIQPSCGCTTVKQPKSELQTNESDVIEVAFNSTGFRGQVEKYVNIETNDPTSQYVAVKLLAEVREELTPLTSSSSLWLGNVTVGKQAEQTVAFRNMSGKAISIKGIKSSSNDIVGKVDRTFVGSADTLKITVTATAAKEGYSSGHLILQTDSKNQPAVELKWYFIGSKEN